MLWSRQALSNVGYFARCSNLIQPFDWLLIEYIQYLLNTHQVHIEHKSRTCWVHIEYTPSRHNEYTSSAYCVHIACILRAYCVHIACILRLMHIKWWWTSGVAGDRVNPLTNKTQKMSAYCLRVVAPAGAVQHWLLHRMLSTFLVHIEYMLCTYWIHIAYMLLCFQQAMPTDVERGLFHSMLSTHWIHIECVLSTHWVHIECILSVYLGPGRPCPTSATSRDVPTWSSMPSPASSPTKPSSTTTL